jgi:ribosomal protein S18 acetylase RimI-like enzyme
VVSAYAELQHLDPVHTGALQQMMASIAPRHATAKIVENGEIIGFGLGVVDRGALGVFEVLTHPSARRRGIARHIMSALMAWGAASGAHETYLQVVATNAAAIRLYADLGYKEAYRYWYRIGA